MYAHTYKRCLPHNSAFLQDRSLNRLWPVTDAASEQEYGGADMMGGEQRELCANI